jgi:transposase-like protein
MYLIQACTICIVKKKTVLVCPHCGSASLYYEAGLVTGYKYHCKDCDYVGALVIEKDLPESKKE